MDTPNPKSILIVDDDPRIRELLLRYLSQQGFDTDAYADASRIDQRLQQRRPDLIVLDLMLPGEDGLSVVRRLRAHGENIPVIMLTAKGDDIDRIIGLEMGADDYLPKPFNPRELVARIQAVLRRHATLPALAAETAPDQLYEFGPFTLDAGQRQLRRGEEDIPLTQAEFAMLLVLVAHPRKPLSRERLMQLARGRDIDAMDRSVDVQISRLRKLVEQDSSQPQYIRTVWGFGYVFVPDGVA